MRRTGAVLGVMAALAGVLTACGDDEAGGRVQIELFQFKSEAIETFKGIVADFEAEHPDIDVVQNDTPDADTAIRVRLVREDIPDVIMLNASGNFGQLAMADVFHDFADAPVLDDVNPAILEIMQDLGTGGPGQVNGLPFSSNADGIIYNKDLFAQHGVEVPTTYDELIAAAETFRSAGVDPFYLTLKEAWTSLPAFNSLASNTTSDDFWPNMVEGRGTFAEAYPPVADRLEELFSYGQDGMFSRDYASGNQAFARGEAAMYLQGIWAIPAIRTFEPDFEIGVFAMPTDDPAKTKLVSGVDVAITMGTDPEHPEESMELIEYLMSPEVMTRYAADQAAFPTLEGTTSEDPALQELVPYFEDERLVGFSDHQIPASIPLQAILQEFLIDGDEQAFLARLDNEWDKYLRRRPER